MRLNVPDLNASYYSEYMRRQDVRTSQTAFADFWIKYEWHFYCWWNYECNRDRSRSKCDPFGILNGSGRIKMWLKNSFSQNMKFAMTFSFIKISVIIATRLKNKNKNNLTGEVVFYEREWVIINLSYFSFSFYMYCC